MTSMLLLLSSFFLLVTSSYSQKYPLLISSTILRQFENNYKRRALAKSKSRPMRRRPPRANQAQTPRALCL